MHECVCGVGVCMCVCVKDTLHSKRLTDMNLIFALTVANNC